MLELFLICALALPAENFHRPPIVRYHTATPFEIKHEEAKLREWIRKNNPDAEVFIHPNPQREKLKEHGFEKAPFTWRQNEIWIQRKPHSDHKKMSGSA